MKAIIYKDELGKEIEVTEIPAEYADAAAAAREHLLDEVSHYDDELVELILEEAEIPAERLIAAIRKATLEIKLTPVLCGSSFKNKGVQPLLDAVHRLTCRARSTCRRSRAWSPSRATRTARRSATPTTPSRSRRSRSRSWPTRSSASSPTSASTRASSRRARACSTSARARPSASAAS